MIAQYHWTEDATEIATLGAKADAIEIAGCVEEGGDVSRVDDADGATFFSVYFHFTPEWVGDPNQLMGALCIADRDTLGEARAFAIELGEAHSIPVHDFT